LASSAPTVVSVPLPVVETWWNVAVDVPMLKNAVQPLADVRWL
jgi:hypothetical protein